MTFPIEHILRRTPPRGSRFALGAETDRTGTTWAALLVLQASAFAVVLAALPYPVFELDRYTIPKELVLQAAALAAGLLCLASARRLPVFAVDLLLAGFLSLSALSALFASNGWLAFRALGVSLAGVTLFWCARSVARAGWGAPLLRGLAAAVVLGALTGLAQAYGLVNTSLASLSRAPGGSFGNRNFMAHLVTVGFPLLLLVTVEARSRWRFLLGSIGVGVAAAALVLSRSRGAWVGAGACGVFLAVEGLWVGRLLAEDRLRRRMVRLASAAVAGLVLALVVPNRLNWRSDSPYLDSLTGVANYREGSGRGRLIQYGNTLEMAAGHPLLGVARGTGPSSIPGTCRPETRRSTPVTSFLPIRGPAATGWRCWPSVDCWRSCCSRWSAARWPRGHGAECAGCRPPGPRSPT